MRRLMLDHPATVLPAHAVPRAGRPPLRSTATLAVVAVAVATVILAGQDGVQPVAAQEPSPQLAAGRILVAWNNGVDRAGKLALRDRVSGTRVGALDRLNVRIWQVPVGTEQDAVARLRKDSHVAYAERDVEREAEALPDDPYLPTGSGSYYGGQWDVGRTRTSTVWSTVGWGDPSVVLAVVDSGVAAGHPDFTGQLVAGRNVLDGSSSTGDTDGHGTEVAGVVAAATNNAMGIAGICGGCRIMPVKVTAGGSAYDSNLAAGVVWAVDHGARVVNLSFAGTSSSTTLKNAVAYARGNGAVVVAAAGNSGCDCVTYPAGYPGVIAVAASSNLTGDVLQGYSNYGSWVDVAAPSGNLTTTLTNPSTGAQWGWMPVGGTSLAAPVLVGIAGLLLSAQPATTGPALEQALVTGADPVSGPHAVATGRIDAVDALAALVPAGPSPTPTATASSTPTASPTATPSPSPTTQVATYSGSLTRKNTARSYPASASSTIRTATSFGCPSLSVAVTRPDGSAVSTASGPSVLATSAVVASGSLTVTVSGSTKCSFTVTVTTS